MKIGKRIKNRRQQLNMTQGELSDGICTQSQISKIEKDEIIPLASLLVKIAEKLEVSLDDLVYENRIKRIENEFLIDKERIDYLLKMREYGKIQNLISVIDKEKLSFNDSIYIMYVSLVTDNYTRNNNSFEKLEIFYSEHSDTMEDNLKIRTLNSLGILSMENNQSEKAKEYFLKGYRIAITSNAYEDLLFKVAYNYLRLLFQLEEYKEMYDISCTAIEFVFVNNNTYCYPQLVFYKYFALIKLNLLSLVDMKEIETSLFFSIKKGENKTTENLEKIIYNLKRL